MWAITNRTPYSADRTWLRDKDGEHRWAVVVKATFDVDAKGGVKLADSQVPPLHAPEHHGDPATSSLRYEADLVPDKPTTDILVNATAHVPKGKPMEHLTVSLRAGPVAKDLIVYGMRIYQRGLVGVTPSSPVPFEERPLVYEWAYGGTDTRDDDPRRHGFDRRNPSGRGFAVKSNRLLESPAHSIEYLSGSPAKAGPAGFGAIAAHWSPRVELAGTYDASWARTRRPLLPADYDPRFVLCSPADQRPPKHFLGGEPVALLHMTAAGLLRFTLPKVWLTFTTLFGRRREEHRAKLATVIIEPESMRLMMVWQTSLAVASRDVDHLDETIIREKPFLT
jgi:hypothetical protein